MEKGGGSTSRVTDVTSRDEEFRSQTNVGHKARKSGKEKKIQYISVIESWGHYRYL